ncbi:GA-like domain-containing protein, partial [Streptococcus pluranimalium]|uniref:GA-like domain-containing protein n=1 Tax=Streptococcus pluranimalium TaxID=82348 RepID=UPI0039EA9332
LGALLLLGQGTVSASENTASSVELAPGNLSQEDSASGETQIASIEKEESANQTFQEPSVEPQSPATVSVDADSRGYSAVAEETGDLAENDSASTQDDLDGDGFSNGAEDADDSDKNDAAPISDRLADDVSDSEILDTKTPTSLYTTRSAADIETRSAEKRATHVGSERSVALRSTVSLESEEAALEKNTSNFDIDPTLRSATQLADQYEIPGNKIVYMIYTGENRRPDEILKQGLVLKEITTGTEITDKKTIESLVKSVELGVYKGNRAKVDNQFPNSAAGMGKRAFVFNYKVTFVDGSEINQIKTRLQNNGDYKLIDGMPANSLYVLPGVTMQGKTDLVYEIGTEVPLAYNFDGLKQFYTATVATTEFETLKPMVETVDFVGSNVVGNKLKTDKVGSYEVEGGFSVKDQKTQQDFKTFSVRVPFTYRVIDKSSLREELGKVNENLTTKLYNDATQTTKDTYDKALEQANSVEKDLKTTQELIEKAQGELEKARLGLELQPVVEAEEAHKKAKEAIDKYPEGSVVNPDEQKAVQDLIDKAKQLKADADQVVKDLPAGDTKDGYQGRLGKLSNLTAPAVNDADNNGIPDTVDTQISDATRLVEEAEAKHKAAEAKLADVKA